MWLRAVPAAERGQDGGIGIAGKSPPNLVLAPDRGLLVLPAENPVRPTPKVPLDAHFPRATYPLGPPRWRSTSKAAHPPGPCSPLAW